MIRALDRLLGTGLATTSLWPIPARVFHGIVAFSLALAACERQSLGPSQSFTIRLDAQRLDLSEGDVAQIRATVIGSDGRPLIAVLIPQISWTSADAEIATVDSLGRVWAKAPGTTTVSASTVFATADVAISVAAAQVFSIQVIPPTVRVEPASSMQLTASARDVRGAVLPNRAIVWWSSDNSVVTVDPAGRLTPRGPGVSTIVAASEGISGFSVVNVRASAVAQIDLAPALASIEVGQRLTLTAVVTDANGQVLSNPTLRWTTSDPARAHVTNGEVTGISPGQVTITASSEDLNATASFLILPQAVAAIDVQPAFTSLDVGRAVQLNATLRASDGSVLPGRTMSWSSSDQGIVFVDANGRLTGRGAGTALVVASAAAVSDTAIVEVKATPVANLEVNPASASLLSGQTLQLQATLKAADGTPLPATLVSWRSTDSAKATVSSSGLVRAGATGSAAIIASAGFASATAAIQISAPPPPSAPVASLVVTGAPPNLMVGQTAQLSATTKSATGSILTGRNITWSTSDARIVTASANGLIKGIGVGSAGITATSEGQLGTVTITITSMPFPSSSVDVRSYGARGDGVTDDTQAFSLALAALPVSGGVLRVPAGVYIIVPPAAPSSPKRGIDLSRRKGITIRGDGLGRSTIRVGPGTYAGSTLLVFLMESENITVQDLTLDGNRRGATFSDEQTHCVDVWRSAFVRFERVRFYDCKSDGLRLLGRSDGTAWTDSITVLNSRFEQNGRSGVAVQRSTRRVRVAFNTFSGTSDQDIDFEPTGVDEERTNFPEDYTIEDNTIVHSNGAYSVTLAGRNIHFLRNVVTNGAIFAPNADSLVMTGNTISAAEPIPLELDKTTTRAWIVGNTFVDQRTGPLNNSSRGTISVEARPRHGIRPKNVWIMHNAIHAAMHGITVTDADSVTIAGNRITGTGTGNGVYASVNLLLGSPRDALLVEGNEIRNFATAVHLAQRAGSDAFTNVRITNNLFEDTQPTPTQTTGIRFLGTGPYTAFAVVAPNTFGRGILSLIVNHP